MLRISTVFVLSMTLVLTSCVTKRDYERALMDNANLRNQLESMSDQIGMLSGEKDRLSGEIQRLGKSAADASWIESQKAKIAGLMGMGSAQDLGSIPGVAVRGSEGGIVVEVQGEVLFSPGQVEISTAGKSTLGQLAPILKEQGRRIRIEGHTDSDPIRNSRWGTNLRLSAERASAVADFLIGAGLAAERVAIAGYGEHSPKMSGDSDEAKRANRRVEILLIEPS